MVTEDSASYAFTYGGVHAAPNASGLFTIYGPRGYVYVGESDDVRGSLYRLLNESSPWMDRLGPLSFSVELVPQPERIARQQALVSALKPAHITH
jgi:hypothetical protein